MRATVGQFRGGGQRWEARPLRAAMLHVVAVLLPIAASVAFVLVASRVVRPPSGSLGAYVGWWLGLSVAATVVLAIVGRLSRRLLPLAALLRLSLVFPDSAPSRFRTAIESGTVRTLEERLAEARRGDEDVTPAEAARRLLVLVAALETHDSITRGHSERVRAYAQTIGRGLRLGAADIDRLNWAALLHDVGKLEIPSDILNKKAPPNAEEWEVIRRHPLLGERLVAPLREWLGEWCDAVGYHHERWDGQGYPRGVAGTEIPLAGRILAVADVFDVITSTRSYKQTSPASAGRREIARCAGTQFDPEIARTFLALSLPRARLAVGPLSWLADATVLARIPLASAAGSLGAAAVVGAAAASCIAGVPPPPHALRVESAPARTAALTLPVSFVRVAADPSVTRPETWAAPVPSTRPSTALPLPGASIEAPVPGAAPAPGRPEPAAASTDAPDPVIRRPPSGNGGGSSQPADPPPAPPAPRLPSLPSPPSMPPLPAAPSIPPLPSTPSVPPVPSVPTLPAAPPAPAVPAAPSAPSSPADLPAPADLPKPPVEIPSVPELPGR